MFPEYRELISQLKGKDYHLSRALDRHQELDAQLQSLENRQLPNLGQEMENIKKEKLKLKDEILQILQKAAKA